MKRKLTALITGGTGGIGSTIVRKFVENDINVISPRSFEMNLLEKESIKKYIDCIDEDVDILINCAGINPLAGIEEITDEDIYSTLEVNLISNIRLMQLLIPKMVKNRFGRIVNFSSIWSTVSKERRIIYSATKAAINAVTRTISIETAKYNVLINSVAPGYVDTPLTRKNNSIEEIKKIEEKIPIGRIATPSEIAELVLFLACEKNSYITGQTIFIDGGYTCL